LSNRHVVLLCRGESETHVSRTRTCVGGEHVGDRLPCFSRGSCRGNLRQDVPGQGGE
jgi:hypothetical protein